jgi:hypothetical protein
MKEQLEKLSDMIDTRINAILDGQPSDEGIAKIEELQLVDSWIRDAIEAEEQKESDQ